MHSSRIQDMAGRHEPKREYFIDFFTVTSYGKQDECMNLVRIARPVLLNHGGITSLGSIYDYSLMHRRFAVSRLLTITVHVQSTQ